MTALALRTSYAQAKELALAQETVPLTTPGSFQFETHRSHNNDPSGIRAKVGGLNACSCRGQTSTRSFRHRQGRRWYSKS
jgi:hypothetical protein